MTDARTGHARAPTAISTSVLAIFFLSGSCALIYETVWQKELCLVFGITTWATTTILAAFMGGLAVGAFLFGRFADRATRPLRAYAWLEIGIAVFALAFPVVVSAITAVFTAIATSLEPPPLAAGLIRFVLSAGVLAIPAILMGGTLPIVSRYYVRRLGQVGVGTGTLYGLNTLGGVLGCYLAGFVLLVELGTRVTLYGAAATNLALAALALVIDRAYPSLGGEADGASRDAGEREGEPGVAEVQAPGALRLLLVASAVTGFCALAYEVLWTRNLSFFLQSSVYAFPTMLTTFLCGSALGSLLYAKVLDRLRRPMALLGVVQLLIGATAVLTVYQFTLIRPINGWLAGALGRGWASFVGTGFAASFVVMLVPSLLMGIAFPLITKVFTRSLSILGRSIGSLYSANTIGCVLGSALAGFAVIPLVGVVKGIALVAVVNAALGIALLAASARGRRGRMTAIAAGTAVIIFAVLVGAAWRTPLAFYSGKFSRLYNEGDRIVYYDEAIDGTITVTEMGHHPYDGVRFRDIEVNGVSVAGDSPVLRTTQKVQGHVPLLLFKARTGRDAERAFILGLGTGEASSCIARHDVEALDCAELVEAEIGANHLFHHINRRIMEDPRFELIINDARNHLLTTTRTYDIIQSDSVHPAIAFNTYTREYYELCRRKLSDDGVFSTWIPIYAFTDDDMRTLVNTMLSVFPHVSVWWAPNYNNKHAILIGMNHPISIDYAILHEEFSKPVIFESLEEVGLGRMANVLGAFVADETTLRAYAEGAPLNTDDNLRLPYDIPRHERVGDETTPEILDAFSRVETSILPYVRGLAPEERERIGIDAYYEARRHVLRAMKVYYETKEGDRSAEGFARAAANYEAALAFDRDDPAILRLHDEMRYFRARAAAEAYSRDGQYLNAIGEYNVALRINPKNPWVWNSIAVCYDALGMPNQTADALRQALSLAPDFVDARNNLAVYYWKVGDLERAREELRKAFLENPFDVRARQTLRLIERGS